MKRRSFFQQMLRVGVAAMAAPLILREAISKSLPIITEPYWEQTECVGRYTDEAYDKFISDYCAEWEASGKHWLTLDIKDMATEFQRRNP